MAFLAAQFLLVSRMGFSHCMVGLAVSLTGLLPMSCQHKTTTATTAATTTTATATNSIVDPYSLGEVTLTNRNEHCVPLSNGKECILAAKSVDKNDAEIVITLESKTAAGKIHDMIVAQVSAQNGVPAEAVLGDYHVTFTPNLVSQ